MVVCVQIFCKFFFNKFIPDFFHSFSKTVFGTTFFSRDTLSCRKKVGRTLIGSIKLLDQLMNDVIRFKYRRAAIRQLAIPEFIRFMVGSLSCETYVGQVKIYIFFLKVPSLGVCVWGGGLFYSFFVYYIQSNEWSALRCGNY